MTTVLLAAAGALIGYLLGSIPTGLLVGRMSGVRDVRDSGSGKTGFTNSLRVMGVRWSLLVLAVDVGKGAAAVLIGRYLLDDPWAAALAGLFAVVGHQFPVFAGFRGGRGVATIYGAFAAMVPIAAIPIGLFGALVLVIWRYASLMSVLSAAAGLAALVLLIVIGEAAQEYLVFGLLAVAAVEISHLGNIRRLIAGTEPKIGQGGDRRTGSGA